MPTIKCFFSFLSWEHFSCTTGTKRLQSALTHVSLYVPTFHRSFCLLLFRKFYIPPFSYCSNGNTLLVPFRTFDHTCESWSVSWQPGSQRWSTWDTRIEKCGILTRSCFALCRKWWGELGRREQSEVLFGWSDVLPWQSFVLATQAMEYYEAALTIYPNRSGCFWRSFRPTTWTPIRRLQLFLIPYSRLDLLDTHSARGFTLHLMGRVDEAIEVPPLPPSPPLTHFLHLASASIYATMTLF